MDDIKKGAEQFHSSLLHDNGSIALQIHAKKQLSARMNVCACKLRVRQARELQSLHYVHINACYGFSSIGEYSVGLKEQMTRRPQILPWQNPKFRIHKGQLSVARVHVPEVIHVPYGSTP